MARIMRQIANPGAYEDEWDSRARCGWADCENPASSSHFLIECFANPAVRTGQRQGPPGYVLLRTHGERPPALLCSECRKMPFCSEAHAEYARHSHEPGRYGRLPAGVAGRIFT